MAVFTTGTSYAINMDTWDPTETLFGVGASGTTAQHQVRDAAGDYENFYGSGLKSDSGDLYSGSISAIDSYIGGARHFYVSGLSVTVAGLLDTADANEAWAYMLSGSDTINGAGGNDTLNGYAGNDSIYGKDRQRYAPRRFGQ
jgi:hypothetical protein